MTNRPPNNCIAEALRLADMPDIRLRDFGANSLTKASVLAYAATLHKLALAAALDMAALDMAAFHMQRLVDRMPEDENGKTAKALSRGYVNAAYQALQELNK